MTQNTRQGFFTLGFNLITFLLWLAFVSAFALKNIFEVPWSGVDLYLLLLSFYAGDKEIRRWRHAHTSVQHRGEMITAGWVATLVIMAVYEVTIGGVDGYRVPPHLTLAVGGIVIIYVVTQYLKAEYRDSMRALVREEARAERPRKKRRVVKKRAAVRKPSTKKVATIERAERTISTTSRRKMVAVATSKRKPQRRKRVAS